MTTTTLFSNNRFMSMYKASLLRLKPLIIFYTAVSFIFFPLQYILNVANRTMTISGQYIGGLELYNGVTIVFFTMLMFLIPLITGCQVYGDMHSKKSVDLYHSLPVTREITMFAQFSAAMTAITIPLVFNYLVAVGVQMFSISAPMDLKLFLLRSELGDMLCWFAVCFTMLAILSFVATQVGTVFDTIIMTLGLYGVLPVIYGIIMIVCDTFVYGYDSAKGFSDIIFFNLSPILLIIKRLIVATEIRYSMDYSDALLKIQDSELNETSFAIVVWFILGICLLFAAAKLYKKRKSECAETTDSKGILKVILKLVGTFAAGILMGFLFYIIFHDMKNFYIGTVLGSIFSFLTIEIILSRSFKGIIKSLPMAFATTAVTLGFILALSNGAFGFERRIPALENVASVTINHRGPYGSRNERIPYEIYDTYSYTTARDVTLESDAAKQIIIDAHKEQVAQHSAGQWKNEAIYYGSYNGGIYITYTLKNGKEICRMYDNVYNAATEKLMQIEANEEFITKTNPMFRTEYKYVKNINITNAIGSTYNVNVSESQLNSLTAAIQQDLLSKTYEQHIDAPIPRGYIQINYIEPNLDKENTRPNGKAAVDIERASWFTQGYYIISEDSANTLKVIRENDWEVYLDVDFSNNIEAIYVGEDYISKADNSFMFQSQIVNNSMAADFNESLRFKEADEMRNNTYVTRDKDEIAKLLGAAKSAYLYTDKLVYITIKPKAYYRNDLITCYAVRFDDLPQHLQDKLRYLTSYYTLDKYGDRIYNRDEYAQSASYGDLPTAQETETVTLTTAEPEAIEVIGKVQAQAMGL